MKINRPNQRQPRKPPGNNDLKAFWDKMTSTQKVIAVVAAGVVILVAIGMLM